MLFNRKAQNTAEYAIILAVVIGAILAMQVYVKKSLQGGVKFATDQVGKQYEPLDIATTSQVDRGVAVDIETIEEGGKIIRSQENEQKTTSKRLQIYK